MVATKRNPDEDRRILLHFTHFVSISCGCGCAWVDALLLLVVSLVLGVDVPPPAFDTVSTLLLIDETAALVVPLVMAVAVVAWTCLLGSRSSCCRATYAHAEWLVIQFTANSVVDVGVELTLTCCLSICNCICSCCNWTEAEPWVGLLRRTPLNWDNNSAIGSTASRPDGDNEDIPPEELRIE